LNREELFVNFEKEEREMRQIIFWILLSLLMTGFLVVFIPIFILGMGTLFIDPNDDWFNVNKEMLNFF
jgi:hypothetical protein